MALMISLDELFTPSKAAGDKLGRCDSGSSMAPSPTALRISLDGFLTPTKLKEVRHGRCHSEALMTPSTPALKISLDDFLSPRKAEEIKHGRCDSEASVPPLTLSLNEFLCKDEVVKRSRCDSEASTTPSTPKRSSTDCWNTPMALKLSLDEVLHEGEEVKRGRCDSEASTTPSTPERGKQKPCQEALSASEAEVSNTNASKKRLSVGIPSRGSKNHSCGKCRPCKFLQRGEDCPNGALCNFCHLPHREIPRKVTLGNAWLTSEAQKTENNAHCEPCLSFLEDDEPWYIQVPSLHLSP